MFLGNYAYTLFHPFPRCHKVHISNTSDIYYSYLQRYQCMTRYRNSFMRWNE